MLSCLYAAMMAIPIAHFPYGNSLTSARPATTTTADATCIVAGDRPKAPLWDQLISRFRALKGNIVPRLALECYLYREPVSLCCSKVLTIGTSLLILNGVKLMVICGRCFTNNQ